MAWNVWNTTESRWENLTSFKTRGEAIGFRDLLKDLPERGTGPFEIKRTGAVLEEHGTKLMQLKPSMIWACAMADLERLEHNKRVASKEPPRFRQDGEFKHYAFHRRHVAEANTANDIIRAAIAEPKLGLASGKKDTRLLYSDVELLKAALK